MSNKNSQEELNHLRHSAAHLLAAAVVKLWPDAKPTIGPPVENGFYYDFDFGKTKITEEDLPEIEKEMKKILPNWKEFEKKEVSAKEAKKIFKDNPYKLELIDELEKEGSKISLYRSGDFIDLCKGGHTKKPNKDLRFFKLLSLAGAYWRGNEKNPMLTRIYGTCFPTSQQLAKYLEMLDQAKKRDHRKIGQQLDLWTFSDLVGGGLPLFTPKGALVRRLINEFVEGLQIKHGITQVWTPQVSKAKLFEISGHLSKYKENMFKVISNYSDEEYYLKPMNCPQHAQIYASKKRSYRDLPLRYSDFAMLYRDEKPGELIGLTRTRAFSQDDCHIFCTENQIIEEMHNALDMTAEIMKAYGFSYKYRLSVRDPKHPEKYLGNAKTWEKAERLSEKIIKDRKIDYFLGIGEASFYAPKLDLIATDSIGREWQLSTLQIDFVQPERFGLTYIDSDGQLKRPVMLHRAISGSPERLLAILLEHYNGNLPVWLSPIQAIILPITDRNVVYAQKISKILESNGLRLLIDDEPATLQAKIRKAQIQKIPYLIIVGDKEEKENNLSLRGRDGKDKGKLEIEEFITLAKKTIAKKSLLW